MKVKIKQINTPRINSDYWDEEWFISIDRKTIAVTWTEEDAKLLVKALRQLKKKKLIRK
jgi:hypothetical protein